MVKRDNAADLVGLLSVEGQDLAASWVGEVTGSLGGRVSPADGPG
ncbi:hypothetical protein [Streptomyces sp. N50]|nr:hypothetical protein [Streptomyces sp. N50]WOX16108.1 hypothetical protein R2B38_45515 [Streptomyces sp. N50]